MLIKVLNIKLQQIHSTPISIELLLKQMRTKYENCSFLKPYMDLQDTDLQKYIIPIHHLPESFKIFNEEKCLMARLLLIYYIIRSDRSIKEKMQKKQQYLLMKQFIKKHHFYEEVQTLADRYWWRCIIDHALITKNNCRLKTKYITNLTNYEFYLFQVDKFHQKRIRDYQFLEKCHDYIQWIFPNHFQSAYNPSSVPLGYLESQIFAHDQMIGIKMLKSCWIFLDFLGIELTVSGKLELISEQRLYKALILHPHNHKRIMRFISCLSIAGFRCLALDFVSFLEQIIKTHKNFNNLFHQFGKFWQIYAKQEKNKILKQLCFCENQDFPPTNPIYKSIFQSKKQVYFPQLNHQNIKYSLNSTQVTPQGSKDQTKNKNKGANSNSQKQAPPQSFITQQNFEIQQNINQSERRMPNPTSQAKLLQKYHTHIDQGKIYDFKEDSTNKIPVDFSPKLSEYEENRNRQCCPIY